MAVLSLLVTDIVSSTRLWAEHEREMATDLAAHDALVRRAVAAHGGSVFKHTGDGAMAAFEDPLDAVVAAVDLQRAIADTSWENPLGIRVRTAVHCGTVVERDGDLFGSPVNRAARIVALCPPGGVIVSSAAAGLLTDRSLGDLRLVDVGMAYLRGFSLPEAIVAVTGDGLAGAAYLGAGSVVDATAGASVLPPVDDELVGRGVELADLWECLHRHHLVSIVGAGGMGKTRLAVEVAAGAPREFADGVWWCDLAAASSAEAVLPIVLDALAARQEAGRTAMEAITARLRGRTALVVLDNCEHVVDAVRDLVEAVRAGAPTVRLLLTSREALGARGEQVVPVSSLPVGDAADLFHARAGAAAVVLGGPGDDEVVRRICARLDGIPLAIELAAARCRSLSPSEIDGRLGDRFRLLRGGRTGAERHRTLLAAVAWSADLLDADEREVFERLAVFADGSYIDGIAAVTGLDELDALDLLDRLVARSMVTAVTTPLGTRYRQLETLRQFAQDRLVERGLIEQVRDAHLAWASALASWIGSVEGTAESGLGLRRYVAEVDNFRLAVAHALSSGQPELAVRVVGGAWNMMVVRPTHEVIGWFDPLALPIEWSAERASAVGLRAYLRFLNGDVGALAEATSLVPASLHDVPAMISCRWSDLLWVQADLDGARAVLDTAAATHLGHSRVLDTTRVFTDLAAMLTGNQDPEFVAHAQQEAAALVDDIRSIGDELALTSALAGYANSLINGGRPDLAAAPAAEAVAIADRLGAGWPADVAHGALARALAGTAQADATQRPEVARQLRQFIVDAIERDTLQFALVIIDGVAVFVWEHDPHTAYVLAAIYRRAWAVNSLLPSEAVAGMGPAEIADLDARASITSDRDAVALALSALDRYLAAELDFPTSSSLA